MNPLVLFDIDNTLIQSSEGHVQALLEAINEVYGLQTSINVINYHGMTDQEIIAGILGKCDVDEETIQSKLKTCVECMAQRYDQIAKSENIVILEGVFDLLTKLDKTGFILGLVTGNIEKIARAKLTKIGINHFFKIGGFGSDHINRTNLVKLAIRRAEVKFKIDHYRNIFLFGDTPRDIRAGNEAGIKSIGVTTGIYNAEQLASVGALKIMRSLKDADSIIKCLLSFSR